MTPMLEFEWRDQKGNFHNVRKMETRHLFHTFKMIWNHFMPKDAHIIPFRKYSTFNSFYSKKYLKNAVMRIGVELSARPNLTDEWIADLEEMRKWLSRNRLSSPVPFDFMLTDKERQLITLRLEGALSCDECDGLGSYSDRDDEIIVCPVCQGHGK